MDAEKYSIRAMIDGQAEFEFYRDRNLYYRTANGVLFPVPVEDTGTATFPARAKGIVFMRWIRKFEESLSVTEVG